MYFDCDLHILLNPWAVEFPLLLKKSILSLMLKWICFVSLLFLLKKGRKGKAFKSYVTAFILPVGNIKTLAYLKKQCRLAARCDQRDVTSANT